jgi:hypothetical protein
MAQNGNLGFHPVYLCLAIGSGAKLIPWMNDAGSGSCAKQVT